MFDRMLGRAQIVELVVFERKVFNAHTDASRGAANCGTLRTKVMLPASTGSIDWIPSAVTRRKSPARSRTVGPAATDACRPAGPTVDLGWGLMSTFPRNTTTSVAMSWLTVTPNSVPRSITSAVGVTTLKPTAIGGTWATSRPCFRSSMFAVWT